LIPVLRDIVGPEIEIIDPSPAIARQVGRIIAGQRNDPAHTGRATYFTSGDPATFHTLALRLIDEPVTREQVFGLEWRGDADLSVR
jgi:glutamate racemase